VVNLTVKEKNDLGEVYECLVINSNIEKVIYSIDKFIERIRKIWKYR
jgi:hypothetical protein